MALVILIFFLILVICLFFTGSRTVRESAIQSFLIVFGLSAVVTELLSLINQITFNGILYSWSILIVIVSGWLIHTLVNMGQRLEQKKGLITISNYSWLERFILIAIGIILVITLVIALKAPPNNYDSMTYHMARVANWVQQQSIRYYPTMIERQNYSSPLAEYMVLHLQILSKSDLYANLVQWSGFLIAILVVSEIAKFFRISQTGQLLAALFSATMPIAILQSTSTQNDLITGVFCLLFVYYLLRTIQHFSWQTVLLAGSSMGLAILTKGTAYIYCAALGLTLGGLSLFFQNREIRRKLLYGFFILVLFALLLNAGVYYRNIKLYSHPLSTENSKMINDKLYPSVLYANLIRNGAMQIAIPIPDLNDNLTAIITDHLGERILDPVSTFSRSKFRIKFLINEDEAGNLLHFVLLSLFIIVPFFGRSKNRLISQYAAGVLACIILYSLVFKWQPWGNRLQLPIFLLGAPLIGYGFDRLRKPKVVLLLFVLGFFSYSVPYLTMNSTRPLVPFFKKGSPLGSNQVRKFFSNRPELYKDYSELIAPFYKDQSVLRTDRQAQYFASNTSIYKDYQVVMAAVNQIESETIGLHLGTNHWEYPIWVLADRHASSGNPIFIHINVSTRSQSLIPENMNLPKYVISTRLLVDGNLDGSDYKVLIATPSIALLER